MPLCNVRFIINIYVSVCCKEKGLSDTCMPLCNVRFIINIYVLACCKEKGMSDACMPLCDYGFIINATVTDLFNIAISCTNDFGLVLTCGSGNTSVL
jgi:hypothetical protein